MADAPGLDEDANPPQAVCLTPEEEAVFASLPLQVMVNHFDRVGLEIGAWLGLSTLVLAGTRRRFQPPSNWDKTIGRARKLACFTSRWVIGTLTSRCPTMINRPFPLHRATHAHGSGLPSGQGQGRYPRRQCRL